MGAIIKLLILYESRFWKDKGFSGETVSDCIDSPVFNAYDDSRPKGNG
jgi:monoamine oxidase